MENRENRRFQKKMQRRQEIFENRKRKIEDYEKLLDRFCKEGPAFFKEVDYETFINWPLSIPMPLEIKRDIESFLLLFCRDYIQYHIKKEVFDVEKTILEDGSIGTVDSFFQVIIMSQFLKLVGLSEIRTTAIVAQLYKGFLTNPLLLSIAFTVLKDAEKVTPENQFLKYEGNPNIRGEISYHKSTLEYNQMFKTYFSTQGEDLSDEDNQCTQDIIYEFVGAIFPDKLLYHSSYFIPFVAYLTNHNRIPTKIAAKLMYELAWGCVQDNEPKEVLFMQQHLNRLGKFKTTTTYEEASKILEGLLLPKELYDYMLSGLPKIAKAEQVSTQVTFVYEKEIDAEEVEEEGFISKEERMLANSIHEASTEVSKQDQALFQTMQALPFHEALTMCEELGRKDLKILLFLSKGKQIITDLSALEDLYEEEKDASLIEEKEAMMQELRDILEKVKETRSQIQEIEAEKMRELFYFTRIKGEDALSDMYRLDKQHKKNLAILLGKLQSRKVYGHLVNSYCYFLGGDDVVLYYTILPNGMYCILRIFPGEELNTSREFMKDATFREDFNNLKAACERQDSSWQYYEEEGKKAKLSIEELKCSPLMEKR